MRIQILILGFKGLRAAPRKYELDVEIVKK